MELTDFIDFLKEATPDSDGQSSGLFELVINFLHKTGEVCLGQSNCLSIRTMIIA